MWTFSPEGEFSWYAGTQQGSQGNLGTRFAAKTGCSVLINSVLNAVPRFAPGEQTAAEAEFNLLYGVAVPPTQYIIMHQPLAVDRTCRYSDYVWPVLDLEDLPVRKYFTWNNQSYRNTTRLYLADTGNHRIRQIDAEVCTDKNCRGHGRS